MIKHLFIVATALSIQGCSFLVDLAFYNNSDESIDVCNLNVNEMKCQNIAPKTLEKVLLVSDRKAEAWRYSISRNGEKKFYAFKFDTYPEYASDIYCEGLFQKRCDIPVQYESNGFIYWGGKSEPLPVTKLPSQLPGFPVEPNA